MKTALTIVGSAAILMGLLWTGQGLGLVPWPETSFMIDQRPWAWRGAALTGIGALLLAAARRSSGP